MQGTALRPDPDQPVRQQQPPPTSLPSLPAACLQIRFKHVDTGVYMVSHDAKFGNPIGGQQEICGLPRKVREADWVAAEGVYYPRTDVAGHDEL